MRLSSNFIHIACRTRIKFIHTIHNYFDNNVALLKNFGVLCFTWNIKKYKKFGRMFHVKHISVKNAIGATKNLL